MLAISLIIVGILLRFVPHAPNFTPVAAIALFGGAYLSKRQAFTVPLLLMVVSDIFLGLHNVVAFTWGGFALVTFLGLWIKQKRSAGRVVAGSIASSFVFYIVSNFGVWLMGWYPHTAKGLLDCYIMALPFLRDFIVATLCFAAVFFGAYALIASRVRYTRFARVLLSK